MNTGDGFRHEPARVTRLDPPLMVDGEECILAALFPPDGTGAERVVVTGIVEAFSRPSSGKARIKARRGVQFSSYTRVLAPGDSAEITYPCTTGGNIAAHAECEVVVSHANPMAKRGLNLLSRAIPGMALRQHGRLFPLTETEPYAIAPGSVGYGPDAPLPTNAEADIDLSHLELGRASWASALHFQDGGSGLRNDCRAGWRRASTGDTGNCTARVFGATAGLYPHDAEFSQASPEYHWDPDARAVRFSFSTFTFTTASHVRATAYHGIDRHGAAAVPGGVDLPIVLLPASTAAGYADTADVLLLAALPLLGSVVHDPTSGGPFVTWMGGSGALEIRQSAAPGAPFVAVLFGSGGVASIKWRSTAGGAVSTEAVSASYAGEFDVRLLWDGSTVTLYHRGPGGGAWTTGASKLLADAGGGVGSLAAWDSGGLKVRNIGWQVTQVELGLAGSIWAMQLHEREARAIQTIPRPSAEAITRVRNLSTQQDLVPFAGTIRRDTYSIDANGDVQVPSEASRDRVRVTCAAPASVPAGTGRPPRVFDQVNFATATGDGSTADPDVSKNRANFHDRLDADDPRELLDYAPGDPFEVVVGHLVFDPASPPLLEYSIRSAAATSGWSTLPGSGYIAFWAEGLVLLKSSWVSGIGLSPGESIWLRARGPAYRRRRRPLAHHYNEPVRCIRALDKGWVWAGGVGSDSGAEVSGTTSILRIGPTGHEGESYGGGGYWAKPLDATFGTAKNAFHPVKAYLDGFGWPGWPFWNFDPIYGDQLAYHDAALRSLFDGADDAPRYFPDAGTPGRATWKDHDAFVPDEFFIDLAPIAGPSGVPLGAYGENWRMEGGVPVYDPVPYWHNWFGGYVTGQNFLPINAYGAAVASEFGFRGVPFAFAGWVAGLPDGTQILEAKLRCKFDGLRVSNWSCSFDAVPTADGHEYAMEMERDGETILSISGPPFSMTPVTLYPDPARGGAVTFSLIGRRKRSGMIQLVGGQYHPRENDRIDSLGSGVSASVLEDGRWGFADVTGMVQRLVGLRNSDYASFELWPTTGTAEADAGPGAHSALLRSMLPTREVSILRHAPRWGFESVCSGSFAWYSSLTVERLRLRYKLPTGLVRSVELHQHQPPLILGS